MWRMRRGSKPLFAIIAFSAAATLAQQAMPIQGKAPALKASPTSTPAPALKLESKRIELLQQSYQAATALDVTSRAILLAKQCSAAEDDEDLAKSWCKELFQLAKDQLPTGDLRAHLQTVAARSMSVHYPQTALSMLQNVDVTDAQSDERASMARMVFEGVIHFKGAKAFPELMAAASRLGETGAYPYLATTMLMYGGGLPPQIQKASHQYTDPQVDVCNQVLQQGLDYFKKDSMNLKTDFQFMTLLRSASASNCPSGWMMHQAATDFANEIVKVGTAAINEDEKIKPHAAKMLYESAQHLLQDIDPVLAESVEKKVGSVRTVPERTSSSSPSTKSQTWESDPAAHTFVQKIGEAENVLNNAPDGKHPHTQQMENAIRDGFTAAQRLIQKVDELDPDAARSLHRGDLPNFPAFLDAAMRIWPESAIAQIQAMPDGEFKAHLLVSAAEYVGREKETEMMMRRKSL
jgi:hypothetical protein